MTCWRRLEEWTKAGVWPRLHEGLLAELRSANALDFSRAAVDGSHIRALRGPQDRTKPRRQGQGGGKHHLITDVTGIPLAATLTGGNRNDVTGADRTWRGATEATTTINIAAWCGISV